MKKFIIAVCGVMLAGGANAAVNVVGETIQTAWGYSTSNDKEYITSDYNIKTYNGDGYDFQYVDIAAATKIYTQGAKFCRMSLAHFQGKWAPIIDLNSCITICKDGYYGDNCSHRTFESKWCENRNLTTVFDVNVLPDLDPTENSDDIDGFWYHTRDTIVLQILAVKSHGIEVAPVEYYAKDNNTSKIESINTRGQSYTLCAQGYKLQNDDCVRTSDCMGNMCDGYEKSDYDEDTQVLKTKNLKPEINKKGQIVLKTCTYFECKPGYIRNQDNKGCTDCSTNARQGVNRKGQCEICKDSQVFDTERKECTNSTKLTKEQLKHGISRAFDCWREMSGDYYSTCVKCNGTFNTTTKECK